MSSLHVLGNPIMHLVSTKHLNVGCKDKVAIKGEFLDVKIQVRGKYSLVRELMYRFKIRKDAVK